MTKPSKVSVPSRDSEWDDHNPNSSRRTDLTALERQMKRIETLRSRGVPEQELTLVFTVPEDKQGQGLQIDALNDHGGQIITNWAHERRMFYEYLLFGKGSDEAKRSMRKIRNHIEDSIKPDFEEVLTQIKLLEGRAFYPPECFSVEVDDLKVPVLPRRGRRN